MNLKCYGISVLIEVYVSLSIAGVYWVTWYFKLLRSGSTEVRTAIGKKSGAVLLHIIVDIRRYWDHWGLTPFVVCHLSISHFLFLQTLTAAEKALLVMTRSMWSLCLWFLVIDAVITINIQVGSMPWKKWSELLCAMLKTDSLKGLNDKWHVARYSFNKSNASSVIGSLNKQLTVLWLHYEFVCLIMSDFQLTTVLSSFNCFIS